MDGKEYQKKLEERQTEIKWIEKLIQYGGYCPLCGYHDDPRIIEGHHPFGRKNDPFIIPVCPNCHQELTQNQLQVIEIKDREDNDKLTILGLVLNGIADILLLIGRILKEWARKIFDGVLA